jgi:hypothetical protein
VLLQNGGILQRLHHKTVFDVFDALYKDKSNQQFNVLFSCSEKYELPYEGKTYKNQIRFVTFAFQDPLL